MNRWVVLSVFAVLMGALSATNVNADFRDSGVTDPEFHVSTDMQFTTDFTLSLVSGEVVSGNPANLQSGDAVCSNSTLRVTPTTNTKWAVSSLTAVSSFAFCDIPNCQMIAYGGGVNTNRNVAWLSSATWNSQEGIGIANDVSQNTGNWDTLGHSNFQDQPVTYSMFPGESNASKEGGVGVFCKGSLEVLDAGVVVPGGSTAMPTSASKDFVVGTNGAHTISTRLAGVDCFSAILKHPINNVDNPSKFRLYYFAHNQPAIASEIATDTININVQNAGGTCAMHETQVVASGSLSDEDLTMVRVRMHNDGDPIRVTGVSSTDADFTAAPFNPAVCGILGFPPALCPGSNGFNENIGAGGDKDLFVLVTANPGASGGTTLSFTAQTVSTACGGASMCNDGVDLNGAITCEIDPAALNLGTLEVANFDVQCFNLAHDPIACAGSNWFWADGLAGDFIEKDNTHAWAYTTSPPGASGTLRYQSGIALCLSDIDVENPQYECEFIPPSAIMNISTSKYFELNCFVNDAPSEPDDADYSLIDGLSGSTSGGDTDGVTYNAPGSPDSGTLRGFGQFDDAPDPILGAVALAPITVVNGTGGNNTSCPNPNGCGPGGDGSTQYCTIGNGPFTPFTGFYGWLPIMCGEFANQTCANVGWSIQPPSSGTLSGSSNTGTYVNITGNPGTSGEIIAIVDDEGHGCSKPFSIGEPQCWQQS
jgi:hypothetical protein